MKITTKTGDKGNTSLFGGRRVSKTSPYVELVGELDSLQSFLGWCKVAEEKGGSVGRHRVVDVFDRIQGDIYRMMAIVGFEMKCPKNIQPISEDDVKFLEKESEKYCAMVDRQMKFIKPGSTEMAARLHVARSVCRRVERRTVECSEKITDEKVGDKKCDDWNGGEFEYILKYLNRLSDLLFALAYSFEKEIKNC